MMQLWLYDERDPGWYEDLGTAVRKEVGGSTLGTIADTVATMMRRLDKTEREKVGGVRLGFHMRTPLLRRSPTRSERAA